MQTLTAKKYSKAYGTCLATVYNMIARGELKTMPGTKKIIVSDKEFTEHEKLENRLELSKARWNELILKAHRGSASKAEVVETITTELKEYTSKNFNVTGFDEKSIYRKIKAGKVSRKVRKDKLSIKNKILSKQIDEDTTNFDRLFDLAAAVYTKNAKKNISLLVDKMLLFAQKNEAFWEFAAVSPNTLWKILKRELQAAGYDNVHDYLNHRNLVHKKRMYVPGAFTSNIGFMDYIIGDDHKFDVASVLVWDEVKKAYVPKQVKIWLWIEARTMYPVGYIIKVGDFTADDLKKSLAEVFYKYGLPNKAVMVDNGIGRAQSFIDFVTTCSSDLEGLEGFTAKYSPFDSDSPIEFSQAYTPTNKSPGERIFRMFKDEHDVERENHVGPDKMRESRHRGLSMSPEKTLEYFHEFKKSFENYLHGFYLERPRRRMIDGRRERISVKDYWNFCIKNHKKNEIDAVKIRFAFGKFDIKKFTSRFEFRSNVYIPEPGTSIPLSFYNRDYAVYYNPDNLSEVDLYALDSMLDRMTGEAIEKGERVVTLLSLSADDPEVRKKVAAYNKQINKLHKKSAQILQTRNEALSGMDEELSADKVAANGALIEERKESIKQLEAELNKVGKPEKINKGLLPKRENQEPEELELDSAEYELE